MGKSFLFSIGNNWFGRKHYRGSYQSDIWRWTPGSDPVQLTTHRGYDSDPMWSADGQHIYFRSDSTGVFNLWQMNADGSGKKQLTQFADDGVRSAHIARRSSQIVFEADSTLYIYDANTSNLRQLKIDVAPDLIENPVSFVTYSRDAEELAVSSDGAEYAMAIHGEIVLVNRETGGRAIVPAPSPARELFLSFKPGSCDSLLFTTDRWGYQSIALLVADDTGKALLRKAKHPKLISIDRRYRRLPDGKLVAEG